MAPARTLFVWPIPALARDGPVIIRIDDTLDRRTGRRIIAITNNSYAAIDRLNAVRDRACIASYLCSDARLSDPPPPHTARILGRPRRTGGRQPSLAMPPAKSGRMVGRNHNRLLCRANRQSPA
ncbi:hypothetical protein [Gluconacetobacter asukensis]|uniref:Transposase n=1 Tax=Gluconacetobacter asukensis TaxID=1017181 RepID=A0A7W4J237_9PROT|nr:hypothetical protein [Gluconacetobacter asukensis]MBB2173179.1 hypothetical protein [Gluconacetobacter asukensis]